MIYLLHFTKPLGDPDRPRMSASHYLGFAETPEAVILRVDEHRRGQGASITRAAVNIGAELLLVGVWPGDRNEERRRKHWNHRRRCCACTPALLHQALEALVHA